jgi:hypothetical protein
MVHEPHDPRQDALRRLEERLDKASEAAERLIAEAAAKAAAGPGAPPSRPDPGANPGRSDADAQPPPGGWQVPGADERPGSGRDLELLLQLLRSLRDLIPPELQQRLAEAFRDLLVALRALIDSYLERVEQRRAAPAEVQDIPIL